MQAIEIHSLFQADEAYRELGATHYHDSHYPGSRRMCDWGWREGGLFSRHYFNAEGTEIGLVIPDFFPLDMGVQIFDKPRVWGIEHDLHPLTV